MTKKIVTQPGDRFGRLTVIEPPRAGQYRAVVVCDCGKQGEVSIYSLTAGNTQSCGCLKKEKASRTNLEIRASGRPIGRKASLMSVGDRHGRLTLLERAENRNGQPYWKVRCDCGSVKEVQQGNLRRGVTTSCGCYQKEVWLAQRTKHGYSLEKDKKSEYRTWQNIRSRTTNPKTPGFYLYGGRGIQMCERWLQSFHAFYEDMGPRPGPNYSIDRMDPNGDYAPDNCRWATAEEQACNRRDTLLLLVDGQVIRGAPRAAKVLGVHEDGLWRAISRGKTSIRGTPFELLGRVGDIDPEILERAA